MSGKKKKFGRKGPGIAEGQKVDDEGLRTTLAIVRAPIGTAGIVLERSQNFGKVIFE